MERWQFLYMLHNILCVCFGLMYIGLPVYNGIKHHTRYLPVVVCYPFDSFKTPTYQLLFLYQSCFAMFLIMQAVNWDHFLIGMLFFGCSECDVLCDRFRNLKIIGAEDEKSYEAKLIDCIKHHKKIKR